MAMAMAMARPPRGLLAVLLALWAEYQLQQKPRLGVLAQGGVEEGDNPCYLDAELGCAAEEKSCGRISDRCGGTIGARALSLCQQPFIQRLPSRYPATWSGVGALLVRSLACLGRTAR
eukprot:COSAG02_NODE_6487_length_3542_cov_3.373221_2_plen_118_part_00